MIISWPIKLQFHQKHFAQCGRISRLKTNYGMMRLWIKMTGCTQRTLSSARIHSSVVTTRSLKSGRTSRHGMSSRQNDGRCAKNCFQISLKMPLSWETSISSTRYVSLPPLPRNAYKNPDPPQIEPTTFRTWLRILSNVPKAILWLLRFPDLGETNLKRTAREWAGKDIADRIWFTDVAPKHLHISRARVCDLFLDTPECNAHTTAADVLWSSTPLLTLPRYKYKMCSRMAASILKGALPKSRAGDAAAAELIARDDDEYERFAIRLAGGLSYRHNEKLGRWEAVGRLAELRKVLFEARWECALFDTRRWVRDLEDAYAIAWQRWVDDEGGDIYL